MRLRRCSLNNSVQVCLAPNLLWAATHPTSSSPEGCYPLAPLCSQALEERVTAGGAAHVLTSRPFSGSSESW